MAIIGLHMGTPITEISKKLERSCHTIQRWRAGFLENGVEGLGTSRSKKVPDHVSQHVLLKKERLIELIHESAKRVNRGRSRRLLWVTCRRTAPLSQAPLCLLDPESSLGHLARAQAAANM